MARFDISGASSRTPFAPKMVERNVTRNVIRKEIEPMVKDTPSEIKPMLEEEIMSSNNTNPLKMAALQTVDFESRKDNYGNPKIYELPSGDMGGRYEVAGINDRYHPEAYKRISSLPHRKKGGSRRSVYCGLHRSAGFKATATHPALCPGHGV